MKVWRISGRKAHSDHQAIFLDLENDGNEIRKHTGGGKIRVVGRSIGTFNKKISLTALKGGHGLWRAAMEIVGKLCQRITGGCDTTMHRRYLHHYIKPNYWCNHEKWCWSHHFCEKRNLTRNFQSKLKKVIWRNIQDCYKQLCPDANVLTEIALKRLWLNWMLLAIWHS